MKQPLMKWTGSKRPIASKIVSYFPNEIETYYEPFIGGGSVFFELLQSNIKCGKYVISDKNESLIGILKMVKDDPKLLIEGYKVHWDKLQADSNYFYLARDEYNKNKCPIIFYFLTRTCYNGTIRYNRKGEFNTSFHFGRKGMNPDKIQEIVDFYHKLMDGKPIEINCTSFETVVPLNENDIVYLDPPYTNTDALYHGNIALDSLTSWIDNLKCKWFMNMNGVNGSDNEEIFDFKNTEKILLKSGNSSFSRLKGKNVTVSEYFYFKK